mgnify:CR=1 FL=1
MRDILSPNFYFYTLNQSIDSRLALVSPSSGLVTSSCESPPAMYSSFAEIVRIEASRPIRRLLLIALIPWQ